MGLHLFCRLRQYAHADYSNCACTGTCEHLDPVTPATPQASAESQCNAFVGRTFGEATVTKATFVLAKRNVPEFCVVLGEIAKDLDFEVRMPTDWRSSAVHRAD